jgi:hypothetical protein
MTMDDPKVVLIVGVNCEDPVRDAEFNSWYENVHMVEVCRAPGVKSGTRYQITEPAEGYPKYLAMYEMKGQDGLEKYDAYRKDQAQGKVPPFTPGPPLRVIWRKAYRRLGPEVSRKK